MASEAVACDGGCATRSWADRSGPVGYLDLDRRVNIGRVHVGQLYGGLDFATGTIATGSVGDGGHDGSV